MKRVYLAHDRRTDGKNVCIEFPYDEQLIKIIRQIPGRIWVHEERLWRCPLRSLPQIINGLESEGFQFSEVLRQKAKEIEEKQIKQAQKCEQERLAEEQLRTEIAAGEEAAFIPSSNASLTRKLKKFGAYEIIKEENDYGQQVAGLKVLEKDLLATLSEMGEPTDPVSRLLVMLNYAWLVNAEAKEKSYLSSQYRYMKKGYLLDELSRLAATQQRFTWGWKKDPQPPANGAEWVLYFECNGMQCSFHAFERGEGPEFPDEWDAQEHQTFPFAAYLAQGKPPLFEVKTGRKNPHQPRRRRR